MKFYHRSEVGYTHGP